MAPPPKTKIAKALAATIVWPASTNTRAPGNNDYPAKRNATGFTALPGGFRAFTGEFVSVGSHGYWWSATEYDATFSLYRTLSYSYNGVNRQNGSKKSGFSVRCLRD